VTTANVTRVADVVEVSEKPSRLEIVLFSGGSGTETIASAMLRNPGLALTVLVNAYDDGHSTGRLRRFIPGMLGPSDIRKNINRMMPDKQDRHTALRFLSDYRLPREYPFHDGMKLTLAIAEMREVNIPDFLLSKFELLTIKQAKTFCRYIQRFCEYAETEAARGNRFDFDDCALGNILFAGCYLDENRNFNRAVGAFSAFFEIDGRILNVTRGENLFLMARTEDGSIIRGEAELVSRESSSRIRDLFLIEEALYRNGIEFDTQLTTEALERFIQLGQRIPEINPEADRALRQAHMIIYGPGTQHSSLLPSYLTRGIAEAIAANNQADKVFISNIRRDSDIQQEDAGELAQKFLCAMRRNGEVPLEWNQVVTHFFLQKKETQADESHIYVPFDESAFQFPLTVVTARDWEAQEGKHAGGYVVQELSRLVQSRIGTTLANPPHMVSIIVPALNEKRTAAEALRRLTAVDFRSLELGREIIFVDGGSSDGSFEEARSIPGIKAYRLEGRKGRGEALRFGVEKARGDIVVFYPADLEYCERDLYNVVFSIVRNRFKVVFGTRAVKCTDLSSRLKTIYGGKGPSYFVSKYGGILLSTTTLFLYNRYVTDTLTSIKGFDARFLSSLALESKGMDLETEIVAKTARRGEYILEVPVEYHARTKAEGKKSTTWQGLMALWSLFVWRFAKFS
jgi:2-phospho-L-lactate transferase/gluconeogenesis factor (CofD/UPF0052 family)